MLLEVMEIVRKSGEVVIANWNRQHNIRHKSAIDLVTETDLEVERRLREDLGQLAPEAVFIGEEGSDPDNLRDLLASPLAWVVDPVDGTTNFVHRIPFVAISVALFQNGEPILGVVRSPILGECFYGSRNNGAFLNGTPVHVSSTGPNEHPLVGTGFPYAMSSMLPEILGKLSAILPTAKGLRGLGSAAMDLAYVACGRLDVFYEADLKPWDIGAGRLLVEEAGGKATDINGEHNNFRQMIVAANASLHSHILSLLAS